MTPDRKHLQAWFILRNPGPDTRFVDSISCTVLSGNLATGWGEALFIPEEADDSLAVIQPGAQIKTVRMRLMMLDKARIETSVDEAGHTVFADSWKEKERRVCGDFALFRCPITIRLSTSEGEIVLEGKTGVVAPIATERFDLRRRLLRTL